MEGVRNAYASKLAAAPATFGKVVIATMGADAGRVTELAPGGGVDMVVTVLDLHAWLNLGKAQEYIAAMRGALKSGGILGVIDHRADPAKLHLFDYDSGANLTRGQ